MAVQLSLRAVITIMVKKRLVNSIPFLFILWAVVAWRLPCIGRDGGRGSMVTVVSLAAKAAAWQKRNFSLSSSAFGNAMAVW